MEEMWLPLFLVVGVLPAYEPFLFLSLSRLVSRCPKLVPTDHPTEEEHMATRKAAPAPKRRRPRGDGSIYPAVNGSGEPIFMGETKIDGKRRRVSGKTETEVSRKLRQLRDDHRAGLLDTAPTKESESATVGDVLTEWATVVQAEWKSGARSWQSMSTQLWAIDRLLAARCEPKKGTGQLSVFLKDLPINDLTAGRVTQALDYLMKRPKPRTVGGTAPIETLSRATITKLKNVLSLAVSHAVSQDVARFNAVKDAKISAEASQKKPKGEIPMKELERLLPVLRDDPNGAPFYLMVRTGLSYQEAFALSVDAYDGEELKVFRAVKRGKERTDEPEVGGEKSPQKLEVSNKMKNKYRRRNLGPKPDVIKVLNRHLKRESGRIEAARTAGETPLIFAQANGAPINNKTANKVLRAFCESLGIEARHEDDNGQVMFGPVTTHVLRHTYINRQLEKKDVSDLEVVEIVGHSDTRMIYSVYKKHDSQKVRTT